MATYQELIYKEIGEIIKIVQYIEWNLLGRLKRDNFEEMTLGQIIKLIRTKKVLHITAIDELEEILRKRNDLVHSYFKRKDFEKHCNNEFFLSNELRYLENFCDQVQKFNEWLVKN
ncbi:MAG: hypothetical protein FWD89_00345 [Firmicutes bacterium]|nr:hypothetical protein [Bacillota bacterium]